MPSVGSSRISRPSVATKLKSVRSQFGAQNSVPGPNTLTGMDDETQPNYTWAFYHRSYLLIEALAFLYIYFGVGFRSLFSLTSIAHQPLSNFEFYFLYFVVFIGVGALVREMFLIGISFA